MRRLAAVYRIAAAGLLVAATAACDETILLTEETRNEPPSIVLSGPEFPGGMVEVGPFSGPSLFVLIADPNGLDDISAVLLEIDSIRVNGLIARPDTTPFGCFEPNYATGDTFDILAYVPSSLSGTTTFLWPQDGGGVYGSSLFTPAVIAASDSEVFDRTFPGCLTGSWIDFFTLRPPAVTAEELAFLTQEDVTFIGISVTVYDAAGLSDSVTFPDLRVVYTTDQEKRAAP